MYKSPLTEHLYGKDDSIIGNNSTTVEFSTPLKKLPMPNVNNIINSIHEEKAQDPEAASLNLRAERYRILDDKLALTPLGNVTLSLNQTKHRFSGERDTIFNKTEAAPPPVFYKPLSTRGTTLLKSFLPPPLPKKARNLIILNERPQLSLSDDEDDLVSAPAGEWTSPVVLEALRRQVNKERQFKWAWANFIRLVVFHLTLLFSVYFYKLYEIRYKQPQFWSQLGLSGDQDLIVQIYPYIRHLQWYFVFNIAVGIVRLVWPQDQCKDLPLTDKQRVLIGLKPITEAMDGDTEAELVIKKRLFQAKTSLSILVPKYPQVNELSGYMIPTAVHTVDPIALSNIAAPNQIESPRVVFSPEEEAKISDSFRKKFDIQFD